MRSVSASEAYYRLMEYPMSIRYPSVYRLPIHLEGEQNLIFNEDTTMQDLQSRHGSTELTAFFPSTLTTPVAPFHI